MADINKFTTKEVLNKVLLDSSGDAVAAFSHTTQEALNAVLDTTNNRLNVSIAGGTISGDLTIAGDLTVQGDGSGTYSEIITGVLQISNTTINGAPINLLSRDTAIDSDQEGVRIRFGKSDDSFLADYGYRRWTSSDKGATITSTDNLRLVLTGQNVSHFMFKGNNSTVGSVLDIRTHETTVVADDVLGKITFSAAHEASGTDAILAGAEIKALATDTFAADNNETALIFSTASSDAEHGSATSGAVFERMRITSAGNVGINEASPQNFLHVTDAAATSPTYAGNTTAIFEDDTRPGIQIVGSSGNIGLVQFGDNAAQNAGEIYYQHSSDDMNFRIGGTLRMIIDTNSRISLSNNDSGTSNTIFGKSAGASLDAGSNYNTFIGEGVSDAAMNDSSDNVGVGYTALSGLTTGDGNVGIGSVAAMALTSGSNNIAIGIAAAAAVTTQGFNVYIGSYSGRYIDGGGSNVAIGYNAMVSSGTAANNDASENVGIGYQALTVITDGDYNVAVGSSAGAAQTGSGSNTFVGAESGTDITDGEKNVAIGRRALFTATTSGDNICIGAHAGQAIAAGQTVTNGTVAIGRDALKALTTGQKNTAIGYEALMTQEDGDNNTAIGYQALKTAEASADTYGDNTAVGALALTALTTGTGNVAIGKAALDASTDGDGNIAIGVNAMSAVAVSEDFNIAIGYDAMANVDEGTAGGDADNNIAIGQNALLGGDFAGANNQLQGNIAIGNYALDATGTAAMTGLVAIGHNAGTEINHNGASGGTYVGYESGKAVTSGGHNTGIGHQALLDLSTSGYNTAVGSASLTNVTGQMNTAIGCKSGENLTSGSSNIYIGFHAEASAVDVTNEIVIGSTDAFGDAFVGGGTNTIRLGSDAEFMEGDLTSNTWSHGSDKRIKKDIKDSNLGLDFINDLRPVTYKKKAQSEYPKKFKEYNVNKTERKNSDKKYYGFIAQEVKKAMDKAGHSEFSVWKENKDGMQMLGESALITPLIKAVQELSSKVEELEAKLSK